MALIARASTAVRNKNFIIVGMCLVALCWFAYDGFIGYPKANDRLVGAMHAMLEESPPRMPEETRHDLEAWPGWAKADAETRTTMDHIAKDVGKVEGWKGPLDIVIQKWIVAGLAVAFAASIWWFWHCQKRRIIAEDDSVSPAAGVVVPWGKITRVDNTRWKRMDIIDVTYTDDSGNSRTVKFDGYELEYEPLVSILEMMSDKAVNAEFIPKPDNVEGTGEGAAEKLKE